MSEFRITELSSQYNHLELMSTHQILENINAEDQKVAHAVHAAIPQIIPLVDAIVIQLKNGGRLFYIGAGTSGRLGIVDASECPPTFGVEHGKVIGIIAGGDSAIRKAVEFAEDNLEQAWIDLETHNISNKDIVIGIAASGSTPYVVGGLKKCNENGINTGCITCNPHSKIAEIAKYPIIAIVGPEFLTGSTRMKAGTAQKLILNMISTSVMIKLGHVVGNKMVDMQMSNDKLIDRGVRMIMEETNLDYSSSLNLLKTTGSVRLAIEKSKK